MPRSTKFQTTKSLNLQIDTTEEERTSIPSKKGLHGKHLFISTISCDFTDDDDLLSCRVTQNEKLCCQISQVTEYLFVGSEACAKDLLMLKNLKITHIINCAGKSSPNFFEDSFIYKKLCLNDAPDENVLHHFNEVVQFVDQCLQQGGKIFIHCQRGVSRGPTIALSYIMWNMKLTYSEAYSVIKKARSITCPNPGFVFQLLEWEQHCCKGKENTSTNINPSPILACGC